MTWGGGGRLAFDFSFFGGGGASLPAYCWIIILQPYVFIFPGHRCTHDTAENCRNDILVTGINRIGPSIREALLYPYRHMTGMLLTKSLPVLRSKIGRKSNFSVLWFKKIVFRFPAISDFRTVSVRSGSNPVCPNCLKRRYLACKRGKKQLNKYDK